MGNFYDDMDAALDSIKADAIEAMERAMAEDLADECRKAGATSAADAVIEIEHTPGSGDMRVNPERVRAYANELLAAD